MVSKHFFQFSSQFLQFIILFLLIILFQFLQDIFKELFQRTVLSTCEDEVESFIKKVDLPVNLNRTSDNINSEFNQFIQYNHRRENNVDFFFQDSEPTKHI